MAHYKVGRFLREDEMIMDDPMYGMTQKAFGLDFRTAKIMMCDSLYSLSQQLETYLNLKMSWGEKKMGKDTIQIDNDRLGLQMDQLLAKKKIQNR